MNDPADVALTEVALSLTFERLGKPFTIEFRHVDRWGWNWVSPARSDLGQWPWQTVADCLAGTERPVVVSALKDGRELLRNDVSALGKTLRCAHSGAMLASAARYLSRAADGIAAIEKVLAEIDT